MIEILFRQTGTKSWDIFRSDRPHKIGTATQNGYGQYSNFTAHEYPMSTISWRQWGASLDKLQEAVLRYWPKFCETADRLDKEFAHVRPVKHGHHE